MSALGGASRPGLFWEQPMSPVKTVVIDGETKLQLTAGSVLTLIATLIGHLIVLGGIVLIVDRRLGSLESNISYHQRQLDRIEAKVFPTTLTAIKGDRR